jgi:Flp pilus assembly protein TadG
MRRWSTRKSERGAGLISTTLGTLVLMSLLLFSLHVLLALQTRSLVGAAAWDAARSVSLKNGKSQAQATDQVNQLIGRLHPKVSFDGTNGDEVVVTVSATSPGFLPGITSADKLRKVTRTVHLRREKFK